MKYKLMSRRANFFVAVLKDYSGKLRNERYATRKLLTYTKGKGAAIGSYTFRDRLLATGGSIAPAGTLPFPDSPALGGGKANSDRCPGKTLRHRFEHPEI